MIRALSILALLLFAASCAAPRIGVSSSVPGSAVSELGLVAKVKTALLNDPVVGRRRIDVHAAGSDITLSGRVASAAERDRAVAIARGVTGVRTVSSNLEIGP